MTANKITDETVVEENQENASASVPRKKKKKRRTIDKAKVAENKKKAKAKKKRQKERLKEEKARIKAEKKKGNILEEAVEMEETVTVNEKGAVEHTIKVEETYVIEEKKAPQKEEKKDPKKRKRTFLIAGIAAVLLLLAGAGSYLGIGHYLRELEIADNAVEAMVHTESVKLAEYSLLQHKKDNVKQSAGKNVSKALVDAARFVLNGVHNRPPEVELTEENAADFATIESCVINTQTGKVCRGSGGQRRRILLSV